MDNKTFSETDYLFKVACDLAKVEASARQASKWRRGKGAAYQYRCKASALINRLKRSQKAKKTLVVASLFATMGAMK